MLLLACAAPPDSAPVVDEDVVLHLGFEGGSLVDDSPNALVAVPWPEDDVVDRIVAGPEGDALSFDGVQQFLYLEDTDSLDLGAAFTLTAWFQATPRETGARAWPIVDKYAYEDGAWTGYAAYLDGAQPYAGVYSGVESATECGGPALGVFDDGEWRAYEAVFDGESLTVSVDGEVAATCPWTLPAAANADYLEIGTRGGEYLFQGALDEITVSSG